MRQAGLKPKSHKSGVYWTRAVARTGRVKQQTASSTNDNDGEFSPTIKIMDIPPFILAMIILLAPIYGIFWVISKAVKKLTKSSG